MLFFPARGARIWLRPDGRSILEKEIFYGFFQRLYPFQTLGMDTGLTVVLPFDRAAVPETECPAIYLLHGHGENADVWTRMTSAERYANAYGVALVMPEVQRSFYTDMAMGLSYFTYVTEELPAACQRLFHISSRRENRFVAGLSWAATALSNWAAPS